MPASAILRDFNHHAIQCNLTGRQMQLWLKVYEFLSSYKRQDVQLYTPMLLNMLDISISQFRRARQGLIDAGFLSIRQDTQQHTSYTLLLDGEEVMLGGYKQKCGTGNPSPTEPLQDYSRKESAQKSVPAPSSTMTLQDSGTGSPSPVDAHKSYVVGADAHIRPLTKGPCVIPSGDIMANGAYHADLQAFSARFTDTALSGWLEQWADMRRKNGWSLTSWGLDVLLEKLTTLAEGNLQTMTAIVRQSVTRRWKGFYPLRTERKPSGEALRRMEAQQSHARPAHQKFQNEQRDLSFLER